MLHTDWLLAPDWRKIWNIFSLMVAIFRYLASLRIVYIENVQKVHESHDNCLVRNQCLEYNS